MVILFPIVLVTAAVLVWRGRAAEPARRRRGWRWFGAWTAAGAALTFSFLTGFSIGVFVLPIAAALTLWVARSSRGFAEASGFVAGVGLVLLLVGLLNRDYSPCPAGGLSIPAGAPPGTSVSCGGFDPSPWLGSGAALAGIAAVTYGILRRRKGG